MRAASASRAAEKLNCGQSSAPPGTFPDWLRVVELRSLPRDELSWSARKRMCPATTWATPTERFEDTACVQSSTVVGPGIMPFEQPAKLGAHMANSTSGLESRPASKGVKPQPERSNKSVNPVVLLSLQLWILPLLRLTHGTVTVWFVASARYCSSRIALGQLDMPSARLSTTTRFCATAGTANTGRSIKGASTAAPIIPSSVKDRRTTTGTVKARPPCFTPASGCSTSLQ
mmetsp:Transcript_42394/g.121809  ORF Transcript_42394/g.121809 Transcript_42394/m.121809 type:complete len:231 (+) Transcript_42394:136-828(+)